nr:unnamed protein product [Digitaria exilis]
MRSDSRSGGRREEGREERKASAWSGSAAARMGRSGREESDESPGWEEAYQFRRSREVDGESGSARRRARRRGVSGWEVSVARRRERSNGASSSGHDVAAAPAAELSAGGGGGSSTMPAQRVASRGQPPASTGPRASGVQGQFEWQEKWVSRREDLKELDGDLARRRLGGRGPWAAAAACSCGAEQNWYGGNR